jgi:hypothetical protein
MVRASRTVACRSRCIVSRQPQLLGFLQTPPLASADTASPVIAVPSQKTGSLSAGIQRWRQSIRVMGPWGRPRYGRQYKLRNQQ